MVFGLDFSLLGDEATINSESKSKEKQKFLLLFRNFYSVQHTEQNRILDKGSRSVIDQQAHDAAILLETVFLLNENDPTSFHQANRINK